MKNGTISSQAVPESRKIRKPIMEKKRRARINESLETLKKILLECDPESNRKSGQKTMKLEKADILEMTVRYLQHLKNKSFTQRMENFYQPNVSECVRISPADSSTSTSEGVSRVSLSLRPAVTPDSCSIGFESNSATHCKVLSNVSFLPSKYNSGGVVYVVPSSSSSDGQQYFGQIAGSSSGAAENMWRPW